MQGVAPPPKGRLSGPGKAAPSALGHAGAGPTSSSRGRGGGKTEKRSENPTRVNARKVNFAIVDKACRVVKSSQGRTYWSALCEQPQWNLGKVRSAKFWFAPWQSAAGAVGMLPPDVREDDLTDWLGYQRDSVAVWLDGACRRNGKKLNNVAAAPKAATEGDVILCTHQGRTLTITRHGEELKTFHNVPPDWCFAAGAFGGEVTVMRGCDEHEWHHLPRITFSQIVVFKVPDTDQGKPRNDVFVQFELLNEDGSPTMPLSGGLPDASVVQTGTLSEVGEDIEFPDDIAVPLPEDFIKFGGQLSVSVIDDDFKSPDVVLGRAIMPILFTAEHWPDNTMVVDHLVLKGEEQGGTSGKSLPDFEISFTINWKSSFHG